MLRQLNFKITSLLLIMFCCFSNVFGQVTWSEQAGEVFFKRCVQCHYDGGAAHFPLTDYLSAFAHKEEIKTALENGVMPPFYADTNYQQYYSTRNITASEKQLLLDWIDQGGLPGNLDFAPEPPIHQSGQLIKDEPDLSLQIPVFESSADSVDQITRFIIPTNLTCDRMIKAIEVVPGNYSLVHHVTVFSMDTLFTEVAIDTNANPNSFDMIDQFMSVYTPGGSPYIFPDVEGVLQCGVVLESDVSILMEIHFPPGSIGQKDSTRVNFYFYDTIPNGGGNCQNMDTNVRAMEIGQLVSNWLFCIDSGSVDTVKTEYPFYPAWGYNFTQKDVTLFSTFPHMHYLGQSIEAHSVGPTPSSIVNPLINVPNWNFEWQGFYFFEKLQKLSQGSKIYAEAVYNNTSTNLDNPQSPPIDVCAGNSSLDEMCIIYFHYFDYQHGDELINLDSIRRLSEYKFDYVGPTDGVNKSNLRPTQVQVYPNPVEDLMYLDLGRLKNVRSLELIDLQGKIVESKVINGTALSHSQLSWSPQYFKRNPQLSGVFILKCTSVTGEIVTKKIIKTAKNH